MNNLEIRKVISEKRMFYYEVAELLGISEFTLSRKLRKELPEDQKQHILEVIRKAGQQK